ncbi:MAG: hypothetical protein U5N86_07895 [Planctomycetota bacterium]|nr:hypothetical protein [Planctomycetota bacterium]
MEKLTSEYFRSEQAKGDIEGLQFERGKILHVHSLLEILSIDLETKKTAQPRYFSTCAYPKFYADRMLRSIKQGFLISSLVEDYYHSKQPRYVKEINVKQSALAKWVIQFGTSVHCGQEQTVGNCG